MKPRLIFITTFLFLSVLSPSVLLAQGNQGLIIYSNDFEGEVGPEWSDARTDITPNGRKFLGQFSDETVSLMLTDLPANAQIKLSFDLFILHTWDGNNADFGPDVWELRVTDGPPLLHTTFSNINGLNQAYPDEFPDGDHLLRTGAAEIDALGYTDSVYRLSFTFSHSGNSIVLNFSGVGLQGVGDESWGLDNVEVSFLNVVTPQQTFPRTVGDSFSIALEASVSADLHNFTFDLTFNPAILRAVRVDSSPFLSKGGVDPITCSTPQINNAAGRITGISCRRNGATGISGSGALATITFEAIGIGESALRMENPRFSAPDGKPIEFGTRDGTVTVFGPHGRITGTVVDGLNVPIPRAEVIAFKDGVAIGTVGITDATGAYVIDNITAAGTYSVRAQKPGWIGASATGVVVQIDATTADIRLVLIPPTALNSVVDSQGFIRNWLLLGPIPWQDDKTRLNVDQLRATGTERVPPFEAPIKTLSPRDGDFGTGLAKHLRWSLHTDTDEDIALDQIYPGKEQVVAYAFTRVNSPRQQTVSLRVGSDDGVYVWLNDEQILFNPVERGRSPDQDAVDNVTLKAGWNTLLMKVENGFGEWGFLARFAAADGKPITDLDISPQVPPSSSGNGGITRGTFTPTLEKGLNNISVPVRPETPFTAQTLIDKLSATVMTWFDAKRQKFVPYLPGISNDFPIEGGTGYIINVTQAKSVTFTGTVWDNTTAAPNLSPGPSPTRGGESPPSLSGKGAGGLGKVWAFVVGGNIRSDDFSRSQTITVRNLRTGEILRFVQVEDSRNGDDSNRYAVAFADLNRRSVVEAGDVLEVGIDGIEGQARYTVTDEDLRRACARIDLSPLDWVLANTRLLQNYPNPFNPETWIPFRLGDADGTQPVTLTIYDITGQVVRQWTLGHLGTGIYTERRRALYWDGRNSVGERVGSGVYFYTLEVGNYRATKRMVIRK